MRNDINKKTKINYSQIVLEIPNYILSLQFDILFLFSKLYTDEKHTENQRNTNTHIAIYQCIFPKGQQQGWT